MDEDRIRAVGVIGRGAIGGTLVDALEAGRVPGCRAAGVVRRGDGVAAVEALAGRSDVVVEAASQEALRALGPVVTRAGADLLVLSVGGLVGPGVLDDLGAGPGRVLVSTGAVGEVDILRAASSLAPFDTVTLRTTKRPEALERPWMGAETRAALRESRAPVVVFEGTATEAVGRFPESVNVAATIGFATLGLDRLAVTVVADQSAERVEHRIVADGPAGSYDLRIRNAPSPSNPRTSAVTAHAVLRALGDLAAPLVWSV